MCAPVSLSRRHRLGVLLLASVLALSLSIVSFGTGRTNVLTGFVHIVVFLAYLMLLAIP